MALRRVLPAVEFVEIGRAAPMRRMRAARAVVGRNMRAFDVEGFHCGSIFQALARQRQIAKRVRASYAPEPGDHRGEKARDAGRKQRAIERAISSTRRRGGIVIDAGEAVHLEVDKSRCDVYVAMRRSENRIDMADHRVELDLDVLAGGRIGAATFHAGPDFFTAFPQPCPLCARNDVANRLLKSAN